MQRIEDVARRFVAALRDLVERDVRKGHDEARAPDTPPPLAQATAPAPVRESEPPESEARPPDIPLESDEVDVPTPAIESEDTAEPATNGVAAPAPRAAPAGDRLVLRLETERRPVPTFEVTGSGATVGRGEENSIRLPDLSVSRRHARITYRQGAYWVRDLGSMSGTWIDGTRLSSPQRIQAGQIIDIGICRLRVESGAAGSEPVATRDETPPRSGASRRRQRSR